MLGYCTRYGCSGLLLVNEVGVGAVLAGVLLALLASVSNATASVLQRKATRHEPDSRAFSVRMLWELAHQPVWAGGITAIIVGFLLQATALGSAGISLVQPLLIMELPFTMVLSWWVLGGRLQRREWTAIAAMTVGLSALLVALAPSGGNALVPLVVWILGLGAVAALVVALVVVAQWVDHPAAKAALLGVATGVMFGAIAVLVKAITAVFAGGLGAVFAAWQTYVVAAAAPVSFFLLQNCLQAARLVASQPALTLANPLVATLWGIVVFGEQVRTGPWLAGEVFGAGLIAAGTVSLARSPLLQQQPSEQPSPG
jgi:drug/metabolite transporter (DMT)-like permease